MNSRTKIGTFLIRMILVGLCILPGIGWSEWSDEDRKQEKEQLDLWQKKLSEINNLDGSSKIEELALGLRSMAFRKTFGERDPRTDLLYEKIQQALVQIPGHAEYYRDLILQARERYKNPGGGTTWSEYHKAIDAGFAVFPYLHSPEGVRVLGEMLSDDWVPPGNESLDAAEKFGKLSETSNVALAKFPIKDKPFGGALNRKNYEAAHPAWQHWYEQIKAGSRTFRFEGDPTEYDLNGPAPGQKLAHISRDRKRDDERATGHDRTAGPSALAEPAKTGNPVKPIPVAAIISGSVVLLSLTWYWLKKQNHRKS